MLSILVCRMRLGPTEPLSNAAILEGVPGRQSGRRECWAPTSQEFVEQVQGRSEVVSSTVYTGDTRT